MGKLTTGKLRALTEPGRYGDGGGLWLQVRDADHRSWLFRYAWQGKQRQMGLGSFPDVGLADAREAAVAARKVMREGRDPLAERQAKKAAAAAEGAPTTFQKAAEQLHQTKLPAWKNPKHGKQWLDTLTAHAFPVIGALPVAQVDTDDVLRVLQPIWTKTPETASRLRGRIEAVLNYAAATGRRPRGNNPALWRGHLAEVLGKPTQLKAAKRREKGKGANHPSLSWQEMPAFMEALGTHEGISGLALRFAILTAARTGEVRTMTWREVNEADALWVVPAARMKAGLTHFVPLSSAALAVLAQVKPLAAGPDSLVFPGRREGRPLSDMTLSMLVRGMATDGLADGELPPWRDPEGQIVVPHGFRATFKAWSLARGWADHLSEKALAHVDKNKVRAAYAREPLTEERRPMMEQWAAVCTESKNNVVPLRQGAVG